MLVRNSSVFRWKNCCDRKAWAACVQSFALWQQATIQFTRDHSIVACSRHIYVVLFFAHIPFMVNCTFSAKPAEWLQQNHFAWWGLQNSFVLAEKIVLEAQSMNKSVLNSNATLLLVMCSTLALCFGCWVRMETGSSFVFLLRCVLILVNICIVMIKSIWGCVFPQNLYW